MKNNIYIEKNIFKILSESYKWRNRELLRSNKSRDKEFKLVKIITSNYYFFMLSLLISIFVANLLSESITTFIMTFLSIFIGLFISILIMVFDKFLTHKSNYAEIKKGKNEESDFKLNFIRTRNFTRRFTFVLLETLLIAFTTILLLFPALIFEKVYTRDFMLYSFVDFNKIDFSNSLLFLGNALIIVLKSIILTLLLRFAMYLFFIFGALAEYMKGVLYGKINQ